MRGVHISSSFVVLSKTWPKLTCFGVFFLLVIILSTSIWRGGGLLLVTFSPSQNHEETQQLKALKHCELLCSCTMRNCKVTEAEHAKSMWFDSFLVQCMFFRSHDYLELGFRCTSSPPFPFFLDLNYFHKSRKKDWLQREEGK